MRYRVSRRDGETTVSVDTEDVIVQAFGLDRDVQHVVITSGGQAVKNIEVNYYTRDETNEVLTGEEDEETSK